MCANTKKHLENNIEEQTYKIFEEFKGQKQVKPIDYIEKLNIKETQEKKYRRIKNPYETLLKTIVLIDVTGESQLTITGHLKNKKRYVKNLGLPEIPDQSMLSRFINHAGLEV